MIELDEGKEREREIKNTIDGFENSHEFILYKMAKWGDIDAFAQSLDYKNGLDMMQDFWPHHTDQCPDDKEFWDQLVIDYYA